MKAFTNTNARDAKHAATVARQAKTEGKRASFAGGGSDLLALVKDHIVQPDVIVHLTSIKGQDRIEKSASGLTIGGLITLDALSAHEVVAAASGPYAVLAEAARVTAPGGRVAVIDFAAHDREELRSQHAHARLGFSDEQMLALLSDAGFAAAPPLALPGKPLTVKIWIGQRVPTAPRATTAQEHRA